MIAPQGYRHFVNTWDARQPPGGGPGPQPGLVEPSRGFGKLWRENAAVRDCLGYATSPDEAAYTLTWQNFTRGLLLSTPNDGAAYAVSTKYGQSHEPVRVRYTRFVLPVCTGGTCAPPPNAGG